MSDAERRLCDWQYHRSGHFFTALFELMTKADGKNLARLSIGFPEEGQAFHLFRNDESYWPALKAEYTGGKGDVA
jgi:hypothetical protein